VRASLFFTLSSSSPSLPSRSCDPTGSNVWRVGIVGPSRRISHGGQPSGAHVQVVERRDYTIIVQPGEGNTHMRKIHVGASALAIAIALAPLSVQAASLSNTVATLRADCGAHLIMAKHHHRHMSKGPGRCGENMFWSGKEGHCLDARDKPA
jgi:hypothetical protein